MISVIIPTYKFQDYLWDCLHALEMQSLKSDAFEVIIILNGCKEPYLTLLQKYLASGCPIAERIRVIQTDKSGVSNARNIGLDTMKGDYAFFLDDDDILSSNYLECMYALAKDDTIVVSNVYSFYNSIDEKIVDYLTFKERKRKGLFFDRCYLSNACCKLIPRCMIGNNRFDINFRNGEDALFMFSISDKIRHLVKTREECIYYRRLRKNSASRRERRFLQKCKDVFLQQMSYTHIYFSGIFRYNFFLYLSRLLAVLKQ